MANIEITKTDPPKPVIIETKGRVWEGTKAKDEAIDDWCSRITQEIGQMWKYIRIDQVLFDGLKPKNLAELILLKDSSGRGVLFNQAWTCEGGTSFSHPCKGLRVFDPILAYRGNQDLYCQGCRILDLSGMESRNRNGMISRL